MLINDAIQKSLQRQSSDVTRTVNANNVLPFVFNFSQENTKFINDKVLPHINEINEDKYFFKQKNNLVKCFRQPPRLTSILNNKTFFQTYSCNNKLCKTCEILLKQKVCIKINNVNVSFNASMTCTTSDVIYVLFCSCNKFYVGETSIPLRQRITLHRQHINHSCYSILKVSRHISLCGGKFRVIPIFKVKNGTKLLRRKMEEFFIKLLQPDLNA